MKFIECVRKQEVQGSEEPIKNAIEICIKKGVLREFLENRKEEVLKAMTIDMTFERREELIRRDEREEERKNLLTNLVIMGEISVEKAAEYMNMSVEEFLSITSEEREKPMDERYRCYRKGD